MRLSEAIHHGQQAFGHDHLKPAQLEAVKAVIQGRDMFVNVPTGYGKSLVYQVLPFCASFILERLGKAGKTPPAVLVVSPLQRIPAFTADYDGSDVAQIVLH